MPNKVEVKVYPPLTEEEKEAIIARHRELVDKLNKLLPPGQKVSFDENLKDRLNNPKEVAVYRIGQEAKAIKAEQEKIYKDMVDKYGKPTGNNKNPFDRNVSTFFRTDNTKDAQDHNEKVYQDYLHYPNKLAYVRYKDVMKINPQDILDCKGDKLKLAEYYQKNYRAIKDAFEYGNAFKYVDMTAGMKNAKNSIEELTNLIGGLDKQYTEIASSIDYFAFPEIDGPQAQILMLKCGDFISQEPNNKTYMTMVQNKLIEGKEDIFTVFENMKKKGADFSKGGIMAYKPIKKDNYNGYEQEIALRDFFPVALGDVDGSFDNNLIGHEQENVKYILKPRTPDEIKRIQLICFDASYQYANEWRKRFTQKTNLTSIDPKRCEDSLKASWFSRWFGRNSAQYDYLMKAYKEFNDPRHKDYLNEDKLREAAVNYRTRKAGQGYTGRGSSVDDRRMKFADDIIATCDQCKEEKNAIFAEIDSELLHGYPPHKEPAIENPNVVEEKANDNKVNKKEIVKEKNIEEVEKNDNDIVLK
ncbi:MAG: hypothetical protein E7178_02055 [Erysipelotrichaceae bacterium]|nr:hypothetical protein [Erysipelotrichaceae bacterium]